MSGGGVGGHALGALWAAAADAQRSDSKYGGGTGKASTVTSFLNERAIPLLPGDYTDAVGKELYAGTAELARVAGWSALDMGHHALAQRHFIQALRMARAGASLAVGCHVLTNMALQATLRGYPDEAVDMAQGAYDRARHWAARGPRTRPSRRRPLRGCRARLLRAAPGTGRHRTRRRTRMDPLLHPRTDGSRRRGNPPGPVPAQRRPALEQPGRTHARKRLHPLRRPAHDRSGHRAPPTPRPRPGPRPRPARRHHPQPRTLHPRHRLPRRRRTRHGTLAPRPPRHRPLPPRTPGHRPQHDRKRPLKRRSRVLGPRRTPPARSDPEPHFATAKSPSRWRSSPYC